MIKVNNKKAIANISIKSLKANKLRNIIAIFAIALTSILFTCIFTIGGGILETMQQSTMRQVGGSFHAGFKTLTQEQYDVIKEHPSIKDISYGYYLGHADNDALSKLNVELRYSEDKKAKGNFSLPEVGNMPQEYKEVATSTIVLDALGVPHEIGQAITVDFTVHGKTYKETFALTGIWEGDPISMAQTMYFYKEYVLNLAPLNPIPVYEREWDAVGTIAADIYFSNSFNIENKIINIILDSGYDPALIAYGVNWAYAGAKIDAGTILLIVMMLLLITASGYLIIFNVFYISVAKDTRHYGLLKTIGTTKKQIKSMVYRQALLLSIVGIPLGLLLGYVVGVILLPIIMNTLYYAGQTEISANPVIFIDSAIFSLITVSISCRKPARIASVTSPMEALRYNEGNQSKKSKHKTKKVSLYFMAIQNVFRNKKKVVFVVLSFSLSLILLNGVYTIVTGFDMDTYLQNYVASDFSVGNEKFLNRFKEGEYTNDDTMDVMKGMDGVTEIGGVYMMDNSHTLSENAAANITNLINRLKVESPNARYHMQDPKHGKVLTHIYGIDNLVFDTLNVNDEDYEKFLSGDYVYVNTFKDGTPYYEIGDKVIFDYVEGNTWWYTSESEKTIVNTIVEGDIKEYTVLGYAKMPSALGSMTTHGDNTPEFIVPSDDFLSHNTPQNPLRVIFNVDDAKTAEIESFVANYTENSNMDYTSKAVAVEQFKENQNMYIIVGGALASILALIGILNFTNSILTSIISRRQELAMLQSVGMTGKQLKQMLICEGFTYAGITTITTLTVGNMLVYALVTLIAGQIWFFSYRLTLIPMLICIPILILIAYLIPTFAYRSIKKESIVERIREAE